MDRANSPASRFLAAAILMAAGSLIAACDRSDATSFDPRIDGIVPREVASAEPNILLDQNEVHPKVTLTNTNTTGGGAAAPATQNSSTPPPPPEAAPPPPPPPTEEGATPAAPAPTPEKTPAPETPAAPG